MTLFILTLIFLPVTSYVFKNFFDKGYIFSKTLSLALLSYSILLLGIFHLVPFTQTTIILQVLIFAVGIYFLFRKDFFTSLRRKQLAIFIFEEGLFLGGLFLWSYVRSFFPDIHGLEKYMDYGFINSILKSEYFPPKDMWLTPFTINYYYFGHLVTAFLTKLSGIPSSVTYNLMLATIVGLCFTSAFSIGANLMSFISREKALTKGKILIAGLLTAFLLTFSGNLHTLYTFFKPYENEKPVPFWKLELSIINPCYKQDSYIGVPPGGTEKSEISCSEDLQNKLFAFPNAYWYPNATRFIYNTIHEFPMYSWVVADLHGHVLDIPFVLLTVAVLLSLFINSQNYMITSKINPKKSQSIKLHSWHFAIANVFRDWVVDIRYVLFVGLLLAIMYMTNAWDGLIYLLLSGAVFFLIAYTKISKKTLPNREIVSQTFFSTLGVSIILLVSFVLFSLPFSMNFSPFVSGVGVISAPSFLLKKDPKIIKQFDTRPLLQKVLLPSHCISNMSVEEKAQVQVGYLETKIGPLLLEPDHCQRSPFWQLGVLYGFFAFFVVVFLLFIIRFHTSKPLHATIIKNSSEQLFQVVKGKVYLFSSDLFVLLLIVLASLLIVIPEFIYVKDIYPAHYRANTMFKLVFQAFMLLSIVSGYTIVRILTTIPFQKHHFKQNFFLAGFVGSTLFLLSMVFVYPFFSTSAYYNNLQNYQGLDGTKYLQTLHPGDYKAISWMNMNIKDQPLILESQGDSYTDHGRISVHTGFPTILGWAVHEWLWRGAYDLSEDEKKTVTPLSIVKVPAPRITEISKLYESTVTEEVEQLVNKYGIEYVYVGQLEREKYSNLTEEVFKKIGKVVYKSGGVTIYKI